MPRSCASDFRRGAAKLTETAFLNWKRVTRRAGASLRHWSSAQDRPGPNCGPGREMSPESPNRVVTPQDEQNLREFLSSTFPALADAPIVNTRICLYCDTSDGHFWIAPDPERPGLIVATGDSGHGFKFAP